MGILISRFSSSFLWLAAAAILAVLFCSSSRSPPSVSHPRPGRSYMSFSVSATDFPSPTLGEVNAFDSPAQAFMSEDGVPNARAWILGGSSDISAGSYGCADPDLSIHVDAEKCVNRMRKIGEILRGLKELRRNSFMGLIPEQHSRAEEENDDGDGEASFSDRMRLHQLKEAGRAHSSADLLDTANAAYIKVVVHPNVEVLLSAGAIGSPQLLLSSDIAEHLRMRLKKEQEEKEQKTKEKAEAHLYTIIKVARSEDLLDQIGKDIYFDLVDHDKVRNFRIQKQMPFTIFKEDVAKEFGISVQFQRFWLWAKRQNHTYRPNRPLTPQEEAQSVGQWREVSNKADNAELKLFLEVELGPVVIHTIGLPKQSTVGDVINDLKTKVEHSHPSAELRLLEVFYHKMYKIFRLNEKIENINDKYWTLRAEEGAYKNDMIGLEFDNPLVPGGPKMDGKDVLKTLLRVNVDYSKWWDLAAKFQTSLLCHSQVQGEDSTYVPNTLCQENYKTSKEEGILQEEFAFPFHEAPAYQFLVFSRRYVGLMIRERMRYR